MAKECQHHFMVTRWTITGGMQTASQYTCQRCLSVFRSKQELDVKKAPTETH
ncbi:hypothetical protein UFOVP23_29 [uncultured Caudovirales phage]|uniref:Uncharacterized protein n=1 Tax=uncultured Caudovirales phage TaxID=2100421 RepID=A0A6J5T9M5_9CAUD|nr:hypothetical protein UFOVP23_29 [uncultured Caudovirales phage]